MKFVPKRTIKSKSNSYAHWFSSELINLINEKKCVHRYYKRFNLESDYTKFALLRAKCKRLTNLCYKQYLDKIESSINNNVKAFWNHVNLVRGSEPIPSCMFLNGTEASNGTDITNFFLNTLRASILHLVCLHTHRTHVLQQRSLLVLLRLRRLLPGLATWMSIRVQALTVFLSL